MKKIISLALALVMVLSMAVAASATDIYTNWPDEDEPHTEWNGSQKEISADVKITVSGAIDPVYYVTVTWKDMSFNYTKTGTQWNPENHSYENVEGGWHVGTAAPASSATIENAVTLQNHSNEKIYYEFSKKDVVTSGDMVVAVNGAGTELAAATIGSAFAEAPSATANVSISGAPSIAMIGKVDYKVATIVVTISKDAIA